MSGNKFPIDIFAVKEYGIDNWQKDFFWPVSDCEFHSLYQDITQSINEEINNQTKEIKTLLNIQYSNLIFEITNFLHVLRVINAIKAKGMDILYSNKTWWYKNIIERNSIDVHISKIIPKRVPLVKEIKNKVMISIKSLLKTFLYNKLNPMKYFASLREKEITIACGSPRYFIKEYIKKLPHVVYFTSRWDLFTERDLAGISDTLTDSIRSCAANIIYKICSIADRNNIPFFHTHIAHLKKMIEDELGNTAKVLNLIENKIEKNKKKIHLLICAPGNIVHRALSIIVQKKRGNVTGFIHGGDVGFLNLPESLMLLFGIVNNFVVYTSKSAGLYREIEANYTKGGGKDACFPKEEK
jgi:hypothetical protein